MLKLLVLMNAVLIAAIMFTHAGAKSTSAKEPSCSNVKSFNVDVLNSIAVKLM